MSELHKFTTPDGVEYTFDAPSPNATRLVLVPSPGNWGLPPLNIITERNYKQDGDTVVAKYLNPRQFELSFRLQGCSREDYWEARQTILNICRPNRNGEVTYTHIRADLSQRAIKGTPLSPNFPAIDPESWDEWAIADALQMICHNPTWYNPTETTPDIVHTEPDPALQFPFSFPVDSFFGSGVDLYEAQFTYDGNWYTYPVFEIHGQALNATMQHQELGIQIVIQGEIGTNETVTVDLVNRTAISDLEGSVWNRLWVLSNIVDFRVEPAPAVSGGINTLQVFLDNRDVNTAVSISFNARYIGL